MSKLDKPVLHDFVDGVTVFEQDLDRNFELLRTANNDNFERLIKKFNVLDKNGTLKTTSVLSTILNYLQFKESDSIVITLDPTNATLQFSVIDGSIVTNKIKDGNVTTEKLANGAVTTVKIADLSVTKEKVKKGELTLDEMNLSSFDSRYYTEVEINDIVNGLKGLGYSGDTLTSLKNRIDNLNTIYSTDAERLAAIADVISQFQIADNDLKVVIENKANKVDVYTKAEAYNKQEVYARQEVNALLSIPDTQFIDGGSFLDVYTSTSGKIDGGVF